MADSAYRYAPGSGRAGPVAVRINHPEYVKDLLAQFRFLGHAGSFERLMNLREVKFKALELLKANYPGTRNEDGSEYTGAYYPGGRRDMLAPVERKPRLRLYAAFASTELTSGKDFDKRGFTLYNRLADPVKHPAAFAALSQMERGAAAHEITLKRARAFAFGEGAGPIGRAFEVAGSAGTPGSIKVPARKGTKFIERTWRLLLAASVRVAPKVEQAVAAAVSARRVRSLKVPFEQDVPMAMPAVRLKKPAPKAAPTRMANRLDTIKAIMARKKAANKG